MFTFSHQRAVFVKPGITAIILVLILSSWATTNGLVTPVTGHNQISIGNNTYNYNATAAHLPVKNNNDKVVADIFYTAYTLNTTSTRPVTFVFNGGPGSASVWLHMGALAPVRVQTGNANYSGNPQTWLQFTDLVFIDPVGTGYSRAAEGFDEKQFYGYKEDVEVIAQFVAQYLKNANNKLSGIYLAGESYGGARAAGLAAQLQNNYNIKIAGLTLISPALNYKTVTFKTGNDAAYPLYMPTYALIAQYHKQLAPELLALPPQQLAALVKTFANIEYSQLLNGDTTNVNSTLNKLSYYTGINKNWLKQHNYRITDHEFAQLILNEDGNRTGIFDARVAGISKKGDPSEAALRTTYPKALANYFQNELGFKTDLDYKATITISDWNFGSRRAGYYLDVIPQLKQLLKENPLLRVHVVGGYYDLATPVETIKQAVSELNTAQVSSNYYNAGHMIYTDNNVNAQFYADSKAFYTNIN
ncbi:S10 family serine carboxypeptidase-like protein [Mucilaginibacter auburnensis]|uniref:Carboxypeptidase C (Cathepsin A) n=1 Tax=Mucilaginibacter auburnensis TaxID=1457233 RepID=A0A2H9VMX7_9SPHI|nr:alpha/beta hydrolase fold domain-containing protein [Mucilaginibacter auburnensis]PJJ79689.1 carboxypeptidase C (cathepsin A) [Mucilaginibacter auburnensis]